ncbi:MAG: hypothetical protein WC645_08725, partial [Candidatus Margulisiibacteriota bacterium]
MFTYASIKLAQRFAPQIMGFKTGLANFSQRINFGLSNLASMTIRTLYPFHITNFTQFPGTIEYTGSDIRPITVQLPINNGNDILAAPIILMAANGNSKGGNGSLNSKEVYRILDTLPDNAPEVTKLISRISEGKLSDDAIAAVLNYLETKSHS